MAAWHFRVYEGQTNPVAVVGELGQRVQGLVYIFVALTGVAVAAAAYYGFTFSPIEAAVTGLVVVCLAIVFIERSLRQRAEGRLEKGIEDLSRLLSTNAQAGQILSQRINALADQQLDRRIEAAEADVSVLGTVIRQVAEAVADLEEKTTRPMPVAAPAPSVAAQPAAPEPQKPVEPVIPLEMVRQALDENRLVFHIQPVVTLPQRRPQGYDLVPRLMLEDGDLADQADFMPVRGGDDVLRRIEGMALNEAFTIARRARTAGAPINLYVPVSRATLSDITAMDVAVVALDANRAVASNVAFAITDEGWQRLNGMERAAVQAIVKKGASFSLLAMQSLRVDFAELAGLGVGSMRVDAGRFVDDPESYTDFHVSDIAKYIKRYGIDLIVANVRSEQQIISALEDGVTLAQGPHIAGPGPVRSDLSASAPAPLAMQRAGV